MKSKLKIACATSGLIMIGATPLVFISTNQQNNNHNTENFVANSELLQNLVIASSDQNNSNSFSVVDITNMLMKNILYEKENGENKDNWNELAIEFVNPTNNLSKNIFNFANYIKSKNENIVYDSSSRKLYWNDYFEMPVFWSSKVNQMGGGYSFNNSANWDVRFPYKSNDESYFTLNVNTSQHNKTYGSSTHNEANDDGYNWAYWTNGHIYDGTEQQVLDVIRLNDSDFLIWGSDYYSPYTYLPDAHDDFYKLLLDASYELSNMNPKDMAQINKFTNSDNNINEAILNNPGFNDFYYQFLYQNLNENDIIKKLKSPYVDDTYTLHYYDLPRPHGMSSENTYYAFKGWKQTVKVDGFFYDSVKYWYKNTFSYALPVDGKIDLSASKTLNELMNWTNPNEKKAINIKDHGQTLFTGNLEYQLIPGSNFEYQIVFFDIKMI